MRILIGPIIWIFSFIFNLFGFIVYLAVLFVFKLIRIVCELIIHMYRRLFGRMIHTIFWAAHENQINLVKHFIEEEGVPVDLVEDDAVGTALLVAISVNNFEITKYLISKGANVNYLLKDEATPLIHAVSNPEGYKIVCLLVDSGAEVFYISSQGITPLIAALMKPNNLNIIKLLVDNGADVNYCSENGMTPLFFATAFTDRQTVEYLFDQGAKGVAGGDKMTPLYGAVQKGDLALVQLLVSRGENRFATLDDGATLKDYALAHDQHEIAEYFDQFQ